MILKIHQREDPQEQLDTRSGGPPNITSTWSVLGPFQIGTRELAWGSDPLEVVGGFRSLEYDPNATFSSTLAQNALVKWSKQDADSTGFHRYGFQTSVTFQFPEVDWETLRQYYGWAAVQFQAWARAEFIVSGTEETVMIHIDGILELWIDDQHFFGGDFYSYRKAPLILPRLEGGPHRLDLRLYRDVRAMGGIGNPTIPVNVNAQIVDETLVVDGSILLPEFIRGRGFASNIGAVPVHNTSTRWIEIRQVSSFSDGVTIGLIEEQGVLVAPQQSRSINFSIRAGSKVPEQIVLMVEYFNSKGKPVGSPLVTVPIQFRNIEEPHRYTFLHPAQNVSYGILKVPKTKKIHHKSGLPILLNLHGAGLEADSDMVRHMLDDVEDELAAFTIFPTGSTPWSGDDWHTFGWADVQSAVAALNDWALAISWDGPSFDLEQIYVVGHSNGGQGTWFALTHEPDRVKGAGPVSGYASIQTYVPYTFWKESDPSIKRVLETSLSSFKHELLVENLTDIRRIEQQHGGNDDNVPPYHSRRLFELLSRAGGKSKYTELAGKPHYYDGIMTTLALRRLYRAIGREDNTASIPHKFCSVIPNSGDMRSRAGILVDQLQSPDTLGYISGTFASDTGTWTLNTSNIHRFHFSSEDFKGDFPKKLNLDGRDFRCHVSSTDQAFWYVWNSGRKSWKVSTSNSWMCVQQRYGLQRGAMDAFLRSRGTFTIRPYGEGFTVSISSQVARNLYQYFFADCNVVPGSGMLPKDSGNVVSIGLALQVAELPAWFPIRVKADGVSIKDSSERTHRYHGDDVGAIFLSPLPVQGLQLNIWGGDEEALGRAARLLPMQTGVGQPDFVIVSKSCAYEGAAGVLACGFFDFEWRVSKGSFLS